MSTSILQGISQVIKKNNSTLTSIEVCAGAGGQAIGLERAGFDHVALVEIEQQYCNTLKLNRPKWNVVQEDLNNFDATKYKGIDLVAGGVPCPPFSKAGKQLGHLDERDLFPAMLRVIGEVRPKAVMIENVRGLLDPKFNSYREKISKRLEGMGYTVDWKLLHAAHFGVPQLRPRTLMVALKKPYDKYFEWPAGNPNKLVTVGDALYDLMSSSGWKKAKDWKRMANKVAPTLVGGSRKHGGADLGPTRAKKAWLVIGVDGHGVVELPPRPDFKGNPRLTIEMAAIIQGFPTSWKFFGKKTAAYRQIGNAFPAPVAMAVGKAIKKAILLGEQELLEFSTAKKKISSLAQVSLFPS